MYDIFSKNKVNKINMYDKGKSEYVITLIKSYELFIIPQMITFIQFSVY